jgi:hypothetical protein
MPIKPLSPVVCRDGSSFSDPSLCDLVDSRVLSVATLSNEGHAKGVGVMRRLMIVSIIAATSLVSSAGPSSAAVPTSTRHVTGVDSGFYISCPGFDVGYTAAYEVTITDFLDRGGEVARSTEHLQFTGTLFNENDPTRSLPYIGNAYFSNTADGLAATGNYVTQIDGRTVQLETGIARVDYSTGEVVLHGLWQDELLCAPLGG